MTTLGRSVREETIGKITREKKAIALRSPFQRAMSNFIPFVSGHHALGDSEGEKGFTRAAPRATDEKP